MTSALRVSVIIPAFNAARYIDATLASVLRQSYRPIEVIVVDDGSTDDTRQRVLAYGADVRYFHQPNSGGCSKPRNAGIAAARGEVLSFFDADDLMRPGHIAGHVEFLHGRPEAGLTFSNYRRFVCADPPGVDHFSSCTQLLRCFAAAGGGTPAEGLLLAPPDATRLLLSENFGASVMSARREVFDMVGRYDEKLGASEDFDLQYRIAERYGVGAIPRVSWLRRMHAASMTASTENILRWKIHTRERILAREPDVPRQRQLRLTLADFHSDLAYYYSTRDTSNAIAHACSSTRLTARPSVKMFARIAVEAVRQRFA
jgi:glycosyltransferase involved in cell wall biosynthesis